MFQQPASCRDCGRQIGISPGLRPRRCSACSLSRLPVPVQTRPCSQCGIPIRANSSYVRCELCRQQFPRHRRSNPPAIQSCHDCGTHFIPLLRSIRCNRCRSARSTASRLQAAPFQTGPTPNFNPFSNSFLRSPRRIRTNYTLTRPLVSETPSHRQEAPPLLPEGGSQLNPPLSSVPAVHSLPRQALNIQNQPTTPTQASQSTPVRPIRLSPRINRHRNIDPAEIKKAVQRAAQFLRDEYELRVQASHVFPPDISASHLRASITRYEEQLSIAEKNNVCSCCGKLVFAEDIHRVDNDNPILQVVIDSLDHCGQYRDKWNICGVCHASLLREAVPKEENNRFFTRVQSYRKRGIGASGRLPSGDSG